MRKVLLPLIVSSFATLTLAATQTTTPAIPTALSGTSTAGRYLHSQATKQPQINAAKAEATDKAIFDPSFSRFFDKVWGDYGNYYSSYNLYHLAGITAIAALFANTNIDGRIGHWYQRRVRGATSNNFAKQAKFFGSNVFALSYVGGFATGLLFRHTQFGGVVGNWSLRSIRALLVGLPPMWLMQRVLGSGRPTQGDGSNWGFWDHAHGVSGHAFMGAVPFMTAAQMTHNWWAKYFLYVASALPGWSRINDNAHYFSQVWMGWWMAYFATSAVSSTDANYVVAPVPVKGGVGLAVDGQF